MDQITDAEFSAKVLSNDKPVLVDIFADWCQPCKMLAPTLNKISGAYADKAVVVKMDGETAVQTVTAYKVSSLPTLLFFKDGKHVKTLIGLQSDKTIREALDTLI